MAPKTTTSAKKKTLKTYEREVNEEDEKVIDANILKLPIPQKDDIDAVATYLIVFTSHSRGLVNKKYLDLDNSEKLVRENKALVNFLFECIEEKSFVKLRNLELFKPTKRADAIETVQENHFELFKRLSIFIGASRQFKSDDVARNNAEIFSDSANSANQSSDSQPHASSFPHDPIPIDIQEIQDRLSQLRVYSDAVPSQDRDLARDRYGEQFSLMFQVFDKEDAVSVESDREYTSLFFLQRSYITDTVRAVEGSSSAFKASTFCSAFIHPTVHYPFLDSTLLNYKENVDWRFPVFIKVNGVWTKYTPRNDWSVVTNGVLPIIISEVISNKNESDKFRMLLQAIALSRAGNYFLQSISDKVFFVVAIYLTADLHVHRYIVKPVNKNADAKVNIVQKMFDLKQREASSQFLLEMFNLLSQFQSLAKGIDPEKYSQLLALAEEARSVVSFSALRTKQPRENVLPGISEEDEGEGSKDGGNEDEENAPSHFHSDEVTRVLDQLNLEVGIIDYFHPNIALIYEKNTDNADEILKFVDNKSNELQILHHLSTLVSPHNYAVRPIRMWSVAGGTMVSLPHAGQCFSNALPFTISNNLWKIVRQLVEGVAFLHENNIAHLDIKPDNLMLSNDSDRKLTIIDFGLSCQLSSQKRLIKGRAGTKGYVAPEVETSRWYSPFRADLYSCGATIKEICNKSEHSDLRTALLTISASLMHSEPKKRPAMSEVLIWLDNITLNKTPETPRTVIMDVLPSPIYV